MASLKALDDQIAIAHQHNLGADVIASLEQDREAARKELERARHLREQLRPPRPFLKYAGGKHGLLEQLRPLRPKKFKRYFEPFVGGGAMYFDLLPRDAVLSDVNAELINCWKMIQSDVGLVIEHLKDRRYDKDEYYAARDLDPATLTPGEQAARMIYLNKTGFNGLYRVNKQGKFNVPFGKYDNPTICDELGLYAAAAALADSRYQSTPFEVEGRADRRIEIYKAGFQHIYNKADPGDFVYFDPPYVPTSQTASFTAYSEEGFGKKQQQDLADLFRELSDDGVLCMLSNSDTPLVRDLYADYPITSVSRSGAINSKGSKRGRVGEVVVRSEVWT